MLLPILIVEAISKLPFSSFSKRGLLLDHSYEYEFNLHANENLQSYERTSTRTRFENEAKVIRKWAIVKRD